MARRKATRNKKQQQTIKPIHIIFILFFVAGITFLALATFAPKNIEQSEEKANTDVSEEDNKEQSKSEPNGDEGRGGSDEEAEENEKTPEQYDEVDKPTNAIKGYITRNEIGKNSEGKEEYQLYVSINELINGNGSCELTMKSSNGSSLPNQKGTIHPSASTSDCAFNIDRKYIPDGSYSLTVTIKSGDRSGQVKGTIKI